MRIAGGTRTHHSAHCFSRENHTCAHKHEEFLQAVISAFKTMGDLRHYSLCPADYGQTDGHLTDTDEGLPLLAQRAEERSQQGSRCFFLPY